MCAPDPLLWNGVYKNYAIYVTDSSSDNQADWGTAVATGTWTWPNLQERKDVTFTPKTGRYVYFARITAYGWSTESGNPGYASANEIWVYEQTGGGGGGTLVHSYYHADGNGNVTCMLDSSQSIVASYKYDPYGRTINSSGSLAAANVYRFSSKEIHANSGMYYYLYRFYDPNIQRWLNRDPLGEIASKNLYAFTANSPTARVDRDGYRWFPTGRLPTDKDSTVICRNGKPEPRVVVNYTPLEVLTLLPNYSDQKGYYCALKCSVQHEKSHISDILAQNPNICVGVANGTTIASNDPNTELLNSEQKAHQVSAECLAKCAKQCPSDYINQQQQKNQDWINSHLYE